MHSNLFVVSAALVATASAFDPNIMLHPQMKRDFLLPRKTDASNAAAGATGTAFPNDEGFSQHCQTALLGVYSSLPTPPPAVLSDVQHNPHTDFCSFSVAKSLEKDYSSYSSEIASWYSKNEPAISSALKECPVLSKYASMVPICTTALAGAAGAAGAKGSGSDKESGSGSAATATPAATPGSGSGSGSGTSGSGASGTGSSASSTTTGSSAAAGRVTSGVGYLALALAGLAVCAL